MKPSEYDGFYFLPNHEDGLTFHYFDFEGELANGKKYESKNEFGDLWQIALFTKNEEGYPVYNDSFEAIFGNPEMYVKNLCGAGLYGCIVRKTDKSVKWFEQYLNKVKNRVTIMILKTD